MSCVFDVFLVPCSKDFSGSWLLLIVNGIRIQRRWNIVELSWMINFLIIGYKADECKTDNIVSRKFSGFNALFRGRRIKVPMTGFHTEKNSQSVLN